MIRGEIVGRPHSQETGGQKDHWKELKGKTKSKGASVCCSKERRDRREKARGGDSRNHGISKKNPARRRCLCRKEEGVSCVGLTDAKRKTTTNTHMTKPLQESAPNPQRKGYPQTSTPFGIGNRRKRVALAGRHCKKHTGQPRA